MRLLLEGPAIEPLLERVRTEHGENARIVHAERVRTGGVGGFFSREHFEVTVEVDPTAPAPVPPPVSAPVSGPATAPSGLDALVAAAEEQERAHDAPTSAGARPVLPPAPRNAPETLVMRPTTPEPITPEPIATETATPVPTAWVFPPVAEARTATLDAFAPAAPAPDLVPDVVFDVVAGPHRPVSTESTAFADLLQRLELENAQPLPLPTQHQPVTPDALVPDGFVPRPRTEDQPVVAQPVVADPGSQDAPQTRRGRRARQDGRDLLARLTALGLPGHLLDGLDAAGADLGTVAVRLQLALADRLVPAPDLARPGSVVLVVGEPGRAGATAAALAARHRLGGDAVVDLGGAGSAPTADHVRRELARLRGGDTGAVVVVGADPVADPTGDPWLVAIARSLGADHVVACVDATRKVADVRVWLAGLEHLGLSVDALDVHHVRATSDPGSVLCLGVPVLALDGGPADGPAWTALLLERLLREDGVR